MEGYELGKKYITKEVIATLYGIQTDKVIDVIPYDPGMRIKVTICRPAISGDPGDMDIYVAQQHVPLMSIQLPGEGN